MHSQTSGIRPAWVEIDLAQLRRNFDLFNCDKPAPLQFLSVVKDNAYGHGAVAVAKEALAAGAAYLAVVTLDEAFELRESGITAPILLFGERNPAELPTGLDANLTCCINDGKLASELAAHARARQRPASVHVEVDTGMSRYGVRWTQALPVLEAIANTRELRLEGVMSHFAMSDELDKSFALEQLARFREVLAQMQVRGITVPYRHMCNSGGYLDLPAAHLDLVRIGILPLGVYPSKVCRRIAGLQPVMAVKAKIAVLQDLPIGDTVGYGMRYRAETPRRIAVLPLGYGDSYPRVRNQGHVLIHGQRAPVVGGNAMDAMMVDVTDIPQTRPWDEAVLMGRQGDEEVSVHDIAALKNSVSYDILAGWRSRLPRVYREEATPQSNPE